MQGGYDGAWYLLASIIAVLLVNALSNRSTRLNIFIAVALYVVACLSSSYFNLFKLLPGCDNFVRLLERFNTNYPIYTSFINGFAFVLIGRLFAEKEKLISDKLAKVLICVLPIIMYCELFVVTYFSLNVATDCFLSLLPFSVVLFQFVKGLKLKERKLYRRMRKWSSFLYLYHFVALYVFYRLVYAFNLTVFISNVPMTILVFVVIVGIGIGLCELNSFLSNKKGFKFLRYSM